MKNYATIQKPRNLKRETLSVTRIDTNKLKTFYYVAVEGSYHKASHYLDIKPSYISKHITSLESLLKCKLFKRSHRSLILTEKGEELLKSTQIIMNEVEKLESVILTVNNRDNNIIRIVTTTGATVLWLLKKIKPFMKLYPQYKIRIISTEDKIDIASHYADVFVLPKMQRTTSITQKKLFVFHMKLFASKKYTDVFGVPQTVSDLDHHRLISYYHNEVGYRGNLDWHLMLGIKQGPPRVPHLVLNSTLGLYEALYQGMGIVVLTEEFSDLKIQHASEALEPLVPILPNEGVEVPIYFSTSHEKMKLPKVVALDQFFRNYPA